MPNPQRLRVGVIGCGGIAQMMHLPYLNSLQDLYQLVALADISSGVLQAMGERYRVPEDARFTRFQELVSLDLDAVFVLTGGNHYPAALAALESGKHVFSEKPLCYSTAEADQLIEAAARSRVKLMVGYMKRYDPGYLYAQQRLKEMKDLRFIQVNTLHPSEADYLEIHNIVRFDDVARDLLTSLREEEQGMLDAAVGGIATTLQRLYADVLLGSLVHDINAVRGLVGEPDSVLFTEIWFDQRGDPSVTTVLKYPGDLRGTYTWTYLAELRNYFEEIAIMSPANRLRIQFPSPYLKHFPSPVLFEGMDDNAAYEKRVIASYDEAFRRELVAFHDCVTKDIPVLTDGADARRDIRLLQRILAEARPEGLGGEAGTP